MLDVTRLRVLVAVARYGSVTAAARALNYAQPSVSHHLARLESETGTKLIQRAGRGVRLTDAGRLLAERAAEVIGRLDAAENELAAYTGLRAGRLRLAAFPSALGTIVPVAAAFLRGAGHGGGDANGGGGGASSAGGAGGGAGDVGGGVGGGVGGVDLRLTEAEPPEALRMLRAGYVDVALVFRHSTEPAASGSDTAVAGVAGLPGFTGFGGFGGVAGVESGEDDVDLTEGLRERLLLDEPVYLVTSAREPEADDPPDLSHYAKHRWIAGCDRCRAHLVTQCAMAGFSPKIAFTTDDYVAVQALVAAELGVSMLPSLCMRSARHPAVRITPLPHTRRYVYAVRYGDPPDPPAVVELVEALRTAAVSATP